VVSHPYIRGKDYEEIRSYCLRGGAYSNPGSGNGRLLSPGCKMCGNGRAGNTESTRGGPAGSSVRHWDLNSEASYNGPAFEVRFKR
jgi:hypothetical protein